MSLTEPTRDPQIAAAIDLLEELFAQVPDVAGYAADVHLALEACRTGETKAGLFLALPSLCCELVGGQASRATPIMAAWHALMLAARILDDVEDGEAHGPLWADIGPARALNVATGLILAAPLALLRLEHLGFTGAPLLDLLQDTQRAALHVCAGQRASLAHPGDLAASWEVAEALAGEPFALACRAGAMVGSGTAPDIDRLSAFGLHLGVLTQIADDVTDLWQSASRNDLVAGRLSLPVVYALTMASPEASRQLREWLALAPRDASAALQARRLVTDEGALHALIVEAELRRHRACSALQAVETNSPAKAQLLALVEQAHAWLQRR